MNKVWAILHQRKNIDNHPTTIRMLDITGLKIFVDANAAIHPWSRGAVNPRKFGIENRTLPRTCGLTRDRYRAKNEQTQAKSEGVQLTMVAMARFVRDHRIRTWLDGNGSFKNIMLALHKLFEWNYSQNTK